MDLMDQDGQAIGGESAGETAASRVRGIIDAAEATAAAIVSDAKAQADRHMQEAQQAAERIRAQALAASEKHLAAVEQATARLRSDIGPAIPTSHQGTFGEDLSELPVDREPEPAREVGRARAPEPTREPESAREAEPAGEPEPATTGVEQSADLDGARLVALNMALGGDSREAIDRYLAEHFRLPQRTQLVDEVYAAVEG